MTFASSVKKVKTRPVVNNKTTTNVVAELEAEVLKLRSELSEAKTGNLEREQRLLGAQALIDYYKLSWEEAVASSQEMSLRRRCVALALGMSDTPPTTPQTQVPFLTKLSDDPSLQGCCNFFLTESAPRLRIGSDKTKCDIILNGVGIQPQMCDVTSEDGKICVKLLTTDASLDAESGSEFGGSENSACKHYADGKSEHSMDKKADSAFKNSMSSTSELQVSNAPRIVVAGQKLTPENSSAEIHHGSCIILGYAHAFRLIVPTEDSLEEVGTADATALARKLVPRLDMTSAAAEVEEEPDVQYKDIYQYLKQLNARVPASTVEDLLKSLRAACPLVAEGNQATR